MKFKEVPRTQLKKGDIFKFVATHNNEYAVLEIASSWVRYTNIRTGNNFIMYNLSNLCYIKTNKIYPKRKTK